MASSAKNEYYPDYVSPPGETLREILEDRGVSQAELAIRTGRPKKTISEIVNGKAAITPETALQLELVLGIPADFWNAREQHYREYLARLEQIPHLEHLKPYCNKYQKVLSCQSPIYTIYLQPLLKLQSLPLKTQNQTKMKNHMTWLYLNLCLVHILYINFLPVLQ